MSREGKIVGELPTQHIINGERMANSDGSNSHQLQLQASSLSVSYTQNSNGGILWSMLPDKWDCPHDNQYGIQSGE